MRRAALALTGVAFVLGTMTATTTAEEPAAELQGEVVTVYSSLPLSGAGRPQTQAIVRGARLALEERGGTAGAHPVRYVSLNDATRRAGSWVPERAVRNARRASNDQSAIGYIGEFNSGASAVSMPILSEAGIADQPVEHLHRPHAWRAGHQPRRAGEVLPEHPPLLPVGAE